MQPIQNPVSSAPVEPTPADTPTGPCWSGFCIASFCDGINHVDATGFTWIEVQPAGSAPDLIAVWASDHGSAYPIIFTPDSYAGWHELNHITDTYPNPKRFYGIIPAGHLIDLDHTVQAGEYDADDYAIVTHTWTCASDDTTYATGTGRRDGRA
jgi:hypothetical protein